MRAVGYVRVSTDKQADRGVSLEAQAEKIRAMAVVHNAELLEIIVAVSYTHLDVYKRQSANPGLANTPRSSVHEVVL